MRRPAFLAATALTALLGIYVALVAGRAIALVSSESGVGKALGLAFLVLPALAIWYLAQEWRAGVTVQRMATRLEAQGRLPLHDGERLANGRLTEPAAQDVYEVARRGVEMSPDDWAAWFHLAFAYEEVKEKAEARKALRYAAHLFRQERGARRAP